MKVREVDPGDIFPRQIARQLGQLFTVTARRPRIDDNCTFAAIENCDVGDRAAIFKGDRFYVMSYFKGGAGNILVDVGNERYSRFPARCFSPEKLKKVK